MTKYEMAAYLYHLHMIMAAQESTGLEKSQVLLREYERGWITLREEIIREEESRGRG